MTCHGIEESFSGYFDTHHGACLGVLTPLWMEMINQDVPEPFARFARNVMGVREDNDRKAAAEGVIRYREWLESIDAPERFADFGPNVDFDDKGLTKVAANALRIYGGSVGRLKPLRSVDELLALMKAGRGDIKA